MPSSGKGQLPGALYVVREVQLGHLLRAVRRLLPQWSNSTGSALVRSVGRYHLGGLLVGGQLCVFGGGFQLAWVGSVCLSVKYNSRGGSPLGSPA